ncbi:MAG TPA: Crp/Fnr family transcriptional regulator [Sphingomicrobium sp.]|nr:Crp/Fnr family transcriptional regulator [Sphingomicrobium sp.]
METVEDELSQIDHAFSGNQLLASMPKEARALLEPFGTLVDLKADSELHARGAPVEESYFPFGSTMISFVVELSAGRSIEVASVGSEGAVGGIVSCGHAPAFAEARVQIGGPAMKIPMKVLEDAKMRSGHIRNLFCRFSDYLLSQVMQSVACNNFHTIEQRTARWLLTAQDRAGDRIELTQGELAGLLGAQRTTVNAAVQTLQDQGLIATRRGSIQVVDRAGLKQLTCGCYRSVRQHFSDVIGAGGLGGSNSECG